MPTNTVDPVTGIVIPTPGSEPGEQYAVDISNALLTLAHLTHTGEANQDGYQIPSAGLNIDGDVSFQDNNATNLRSARFVEQSSILNGVGDLDCVYDVNGDLWFNNGSGVPIQLTAGSVINAKGASAYSVTTTSINLTIPSSATYNLVDVLLSNAAITVTLPSASALGDGYFFVVKDTNGLASTYNITVRVPSGTMDGGTQAVLTTNYQAAMFVGDGSSNWAVFPFDKSSYQDGDVLQFAGTAANTTLLVMDGYSALELESNSALIAESGSSVTISSGATQYVAGLLEVQQVSDDPAGELRLTHNAALNVDSGANLNVNSGGNLNIVSGGTQTVENDGYFNIVSGAVYTTAQFANFPSTVSRSLVNAVNLGQPISGSWSFGNQNIISGATGSTWAIPLKRLHQGATLASLSVSFVVGQSHTGVPVTLPRLSLVRYTFGTETSGVTLNVTDPQIFPTPGSGSAYYDGGNIQFIEYVCGRNNVIDDSQYNYVLLITDESGTNSLDANNYFTVQLNFTGISSQQWSM